MDYKIFAIIVTYNPDNSVLDEFVRKITHQVSKVIIVDNSEPSQVNSYKDVDIVRLNDNVGIAEAQNIGLQKAMDENCDFIFTFDQDSQISDSYCKKMIAEYNKFKDNIGENEYPKLFIWEVRIGSPVRQYYLVRNWIFSLKSKSFDMRSKLIIIFLLLKKIPLFAIMTPKRKRIKFILQGIWDGVIGKGGKYSY